MLCSVTSCLSEAAWSLCLETHCCPVWTERSWEKPGVESSDRPPSLLLTHSPEVQDDLMACLPPCSPGPRKMHESIPYNKRCEGPDVVFHHGSTSFVYVEVTAHTAPMSCLCMNQHHLPTDLYTLIPGICSHVWIRTPRLTPIPSARGTETWKSVQTSVP